MGAHPLCTTTYMHEHTVPAHTMHEHSMMEE